jgi:hypothetical protein
MLLGFDEKQMDGSDSTCVATVEGQSKITIEATLKDNQKKTTVVREIVGDEMVTVKLKNY